MKKKTRFLFIDLIKIVAMFFVIFHHLHFHFIDSGLFNSNELWKNSILNSSYGDIALSLFIFISGLTLTLSLNNKSYSIREFYKRRIKKIYLDFFLVYLFFTIYYGSMGYLPSPIKIPNLLFSLTGLDTYFVSFFNFTSYSFFDWFIGFILIIYLIFPLLYYLYNKGRGTLIFFTSLLLLATVFLFKENLNDRFITLRLLEFSLGMCYANVISKGSIKDHFYIFIFSVLGLFTFYKVPSAVAVFIRLILIDYIFIEILFLISALFKNTVVLKKIIIYLSNISYLVFLLQHQVIIRIMVDFVLKYSNTFGYVFTQNFIILSLLIVFVIILLAVLINEAKKIILLIFSNIFNKLYYNGF